MPRDNQGPHLSPKLNKAGVWDIVYTVDGRSRAKSTRTADKALANRRLAEFIGAVAQAGDEAGLGPAPVEVPTVREVLEAYLRQHVGRMELERSRLDAERSVRHVLSHKLADKPADKVRRLDVDDYVDDRKAGRVGWVEPGGKRRGFRKGGPACQRNDVLYTNAALRWAVAECVFEDRFTLTHLRPLPVPEGPESRLHYLTHDQVEILLEAARSGCWREKDRGWKRGSNAFDPLFIYTAIAADTASREEAIRELAWDRVQLVKIADKGEPEGWRWGGSVDFRKPGRKQTRKRRGMVKLSRRLAVILAAHREQSGGEGLVLGQAYGQGMALQFRVMHERVLGWATGPHILRHTWATLALSRGARPTDIANVLCDTEATVRRVYAKFILDDQDNVVDMVWERPEPVADLAAERSKRLGATGVKSA